MTALVFPPIYNLANSWIQLPAAAMTCNSCSGSVIGTDSSAATRHNDHPLMFFYYNCIEVVCMWPSSVYTCLVVKPPFLIVSLQSGWPFRWQWRQCQEFCLRKPEVYTWSGHVWEFLRVCKPMTPTHYEWTCKTMLYGIQLSWWYSLWFVCQQS